MAFQSKKSVTDPERIRKDGDYPEKYCGGRLNYYLGTCQAKRKEVIQFDIFKEFTSVYLRFKWKRHTIYVSRRVIALMWIHHWQEIVTE